MNVGYLLFLFSDLFRPYRKTVKIIVVKVTCVPRCTWNTVQNGFCIIQFVTAIHQFRTGIREFHERIRRTPLFDYRFGRGLQVFGIVVRVARVPTEQHWRIVAGGF